MTKIRQYSTSLLVSLSLLSTTVAFGQDYAVSLASAKLHPEACEHWRDLHKNWPDAQVVSSHNVFYVVTGQFSSVNSALSTRDIVRQKFYAQARILPLTHIVEPCLADSPSAQYQLTESQSEAETDLEQSLLQVTTDIAAQATETIVVEVVSPPSADALVVEPDLLTENIDTTVQSNIDIFSPEAQLKQMSMQLSELPEPDSTLIQYRDILHQVNLPLIDVKEIVKRPFLKQVISVQQQGEWYRPLVKDALNQLRIYAYREEWQEAVFLADQLVMLPESQLSVSDLEVLGWIYLHVHRWERAKRYFSLVLLQQELTHIHYGLALATLSLNQTKQTRQLLRLLPEGEQKSQVNRLLAMSLLYQ